MSGNDGHTQKTCPRMRAGLLMCVLRQDFPRDEPKVQRLEEIYGAVEFGIVLLGGVDFLIVVPPPGLSKKLAIAKLIGNSPRYIGRCDVGYPQV